MLDEFTLLSLSFVISDFIHALAARHPLSSRLLAWPVQRDQVDEVGQYRASKWIWMNNDGRG